MNRLKFFLLGGLFVALVITLVGFTGPGRAFADQMKPLLVQIVNTPVPVDQKMATQSRLIEKTIATGQGETIDFESIDASMIIISALPTDNLLFKFAGDPVSFVVALFNPHESAKVIPFPQKVRLNTVNIVCISESSTSCSFRVSIIGN